MLPSFLTNLFWAQSQERDGEGTGSNGWSADGALAVEHTASEEAGDWLLITTQQTPINLSPAHSNSGHGVNPDCDGESICSDSSWVITPSPVFQGSSLAPPINSSHPMEDLLIEHPTMSIYHCHGDDNNLNEETDAVSDTANDHLQSNEPVPRENNINEQQHNENNRELVLRRNRQRQQLALHMQLPLGGRGPVLRPPPPPSGAMYGLQPQQLTRRALKRQNANSIRHRGGKVHQGNRIQKCSFKAGRRRC